MDKTAAQIEALNYEAQHFLLELNRFRGKNKTIDATLCANLMRVVLGIEDFLNSRPKHVTLRKLKQLTPNDVSDLGVKRTFFCQHCKVQIGNSVDCIQAHVKDKCIGGRRKNTQMQISSNLSTDPILPKKAKNLLTNELELFLTKNLATAMKLINIPEYHTIENDLVELIKPEYSDMKVRVYQFGSRICGTASAQSDLDMFVDIGGTFNIFENRSTDGTRSTVKSVEKLLTKSEKWQNIIAVEGARVPIIKVMHVPTGLYCDIGFTNSLGYCNTMLLQYLFNLQPLARSVTLLLKKLVERIQLNENVASYGIVLLVVYHFQRNNLLPSIKQLQEGVDDSNSIGPWIGTFSQKTASELNITVLPCTLDSFKKELIRFFSFFSTFDFEQNVVCTYLGENVDIKTIDDHPQLPRYTEYIKKDNAGSKFKFKKSFMNVHDPFQQNHNVMKNVLKRTVDHLKASFISSLQCLGQLNGPSTKLPVQE